jgi:hypothetical protein
MGDPNETSTLTRRERLAVAAFFLVAIAISIVVVGRLGEPAGDVVGPIEGRPIVSPEVPRPVPLLDAYGVAAEWAKVWNEDAWLILVSAQYEFPDGESAATPAASDATGGYYMFTFAGPKEGDAWPRLTLAVGRQSGSMYHEEEMRSTVEPPAPVADLLNGLPITAEQAFSVADRVVGVGYREGCAPSRRQVQVVLDTTNHKSPKWVVVYYDMGDRSVNDIVVRIDALSGETRTEVRDDPSCPVEGA